MQFSQDENGVYKELPDGHVLRVQEQIYNSLLTVSSSRSSQTWLEGW